MRAYRERIDAGVVQLVECFLAKEEVVGSSPIARSKPLIAERLFFHSKAQKPGPGRGSNAVNRI